MSLNSGLGNNNAKVKAIVGVVIIAITLVIVYFIIQGSMAKPSYSLAGNKLTISGQYGVTINLFGATVNHELGPVPVTDTKTNGAAIGKIEKGYFKISGSDVYLNVMDEDASDYILITDATGAKYYINCASSKETTNLYNKISAQNGLAK